MHAQNLVKIFHFSSSKNGVERVLLLARLFNLLVLQYVEKGLNVKHGALSKNVNILKHP